VKSAGTLLSELERRVTDKEFAARLTAVVLGLALAVLLGYGIATGQRVWLFMCVALGIFILTTLGLQRRIWVLILIGWPFYGMTPLLGLPFSLREPCIVLGCTVYIGYRVLLRHRFEVKRHVLDSLLLLNVLWIGVTFLIHPVGIRAFGAQTVGGRPIFDIFMALIAYTVIVRLPDSVKAVGRIPYFVMAGVAIIAAFNIIAYLAPGLTPYLYGLYSSVDLGVYVGEITGAALVRLGNLGFFGGTLILLLCAYYPPWTLFNPLRPRTYVFLCGWMCIFASGFRNMLGAAVMQVGLSAWLHQGWREAAVIGVAAGLFGGALIFGQGRLYQLPLTAQRTLAWLPGKWSPEAEQEASLATEGRFLWWKRIIEEGEIKNWWIGDGFGMSMKDFAQLAGRLGRPGGEEWVYMTGGYHNGPLTAIRYVGVIGLAALYALMIGSAACAVACVRRCRGTILSPVAIFLGAQLVWYPIHFTLIYGSYNLDMPQEIFLTALLRLVIRMAEEKRVALDSKPSLSAAPAARPLTSSVTA
jgi:hypothetical protein